MSTHVAGVRPPDERWQRMKAAYEACRAAGLTVPPEVTEFFDWDEPDPAGVVVNLDQHTSVREWSDDTRAGYEVVLGQLPPEVTVLRFYNSW